MPDLHTIIARRRRLDRLFAVVGVLSVVVGLATLTALLINLWRGAAPKLLVPEGTVQTLRQDEKSPRTLAREVRQIPEDGPREFNWPYFFRLVPSSYPETAGILTAWVGSLCVILVTMAAAIPLGIMAGIYLEEYGRKNWLTSLIEINIANLAGVPSIIYGLLALGVFVQVLHLGRSILTAGLTLALLVLPIVILATREAIRAIPQHIREASYACGATRWQTVRFHILPYSLSGILTGSIIGLSRALGETAPLITIGALTFVTTLPASPVTGEFPFLSLRWLVSDFTVLPIQMFNWTSRPQAQFQQNAAAAGLVLILMTLSLNAFAIYLRFRLRRRIQW